LSHAKVRRSRVKDPLLAIIVGAGNRGHGVYGRWALDHPDDIGIVAVADPDPDRRARLARAHGIPETARFPDTATLVAAGVDAQAAIVASPDRHHASDAIDLVQAGLDVLLEKPVAVGPDELAQLVRSTRTARGRLSVAHVLRYTAFFGLVHEIVTSGRLGDVVSVVHRETIAWWHMAHSFVRGNWAIAATSSPAILAKCCHDLDILTWNSASPVSRVASFGSLKHFRPERTPLGALARCTDGCPVDCPFDARRIYLNPDAEPWLVEAVADDPTPGSIEAALERGPYGRCVYGAGSDVVDHQVVVMERADGATLTLHFDGHGEVGARTMRYDGTRATLRGIFGERPALRIDDNAGGSEVIEPEPRGVHGGGDDAIMRAFVDHAAAGQALPTDIDDAIESHLLAFAAEESRIEGRIVDMVEVRARLGLDSPAVRAQAPAPRGTSPSNSQASPTSTSSSPAWTRQPHDIIPP